MSKSLIIDDKPLQLSPKLAVAVGVNEAIVLRQLLYWMNKPNVGGEREGRKWVYNTYEAWRDDNFPFWSVRTVERTFLNLERRGVVLSDTRRGSGRRKWYTVDYKRLEELCAQGEEELRAREEKRALTGADNKAGKLRPKGASRHDKLALSDATEWRVASRHNGEMAGDRMARSSPHNVVSLNKVTETTSETTPENTHTPPARRAAPPAPDVCVVSDISEQDYYDYARSQKSLHTPDAWASTHWEKRDRDKVVGDWLAARVDAMPEPEPAPAADLMGFEEADAYVEWFLRDVQPKADRIGLISQLLTPEEVKNRLREKYLPPPNEGADTAAA